MKDYRKIGICVRCEKEKKICGRGMCHICYRDGFRFSFNKDAVIERDKSCCIDCGKRISGKALNVHHIDENKKNNDPSNLVVLCIFCHTKRHFVICNCCGKKERMINRNQKYCKKCGKKADRQVKLKAQRKFHKAHHFYRRRRK